MNRLLRSPGQRGRGRHYLPSDLNQLRLIRQLQSRRVPLAEIRRQLEDMTADEVAQALRQGSEPERTPRRTEPSPRVERRIFGLSRATWERIELSPDIELHVRRPLTPAQHRVVDRLLEVGREEGRGKR